MEIYYAALSCETIRFNGKQIALLVLSMMVAINCLSRHSHSIRLESLVKVLPVNAFLKFLTCWK